MDYLVSDKNTLVWLCFTIYACAALFLIPNSNSQTESVNASNERALQFASRFMLRIALIFPMLFLLGNAI